jgi:hypothetical protein
MRGCDEESGKTEGTKEGGLGVRWVKSGRMDSAGCFDIHRTGRSVKRNVRVEDMALDRSYEGIVVFGEGLESGQVKDSYEWMLRALTRSGAS